MPKCLTPAQIEQYREEGCVFPIRIMSETEAAELRGRLEAFERRTGGPLKGDMRHKSHLLFAWLAELVRRSSILDTVEDLHGPDLLCWTTNFFIKEAADPAFVSWHQDSTYWGLSEPDVVTAWVSPSPKRPRRTGQWSTSPAATSSIRSPIATPSPNTIS
jgi:non-haem Fe2+, alpha-ketoglutarate-dependent halogenase